MGSLSSSWAPGSLSPCPPPFRWPCLRYCICFSFRGIILFLSLAPTSTAAESTSTTKSTGANNLTINFPSAVDADHDKNLPSFAVMYVLIGFAIAVVLMGCLALFIRKYWRRQEIQIEELSLEPTLIYSQKEAEKN